MKLNKDNLLKMVKESSSMFEVIEKFEDKPENIAQYWTKLFFFFPEAKYFLERNEAKDNMETNLKKNNMDNVLKARKVFIKATVELINSGLIKSDDVSIKPSKEIVTTNQPSESEEEDIAPITSVVPQDLAASIILK